MVTEISKAKTAFKFSKIMRRTSVISNKAIVSFATLTRMLRLRLRTAHGSRYEFS